MNSLFLEEDVTRLLEATRSASSLKSQQAVVDVASRRLSASSARQRRPSPARSPRRSPAQRHQQSSGSPSRPSKRVRFDSPAPTSALKSARKVHFRDRSVSLLTDNTSALSYLRKEGGTRSSTLNSVAQEILRLCESNDVRLLPQFVPGCLNVLADSLSHGGQILGSEWTLHMDVCLELFCRWQVMVDLFATSLNHRLQVYFSPMADPQAAAVDALIQSWDHLQAYAFPPFSLIQRVLSKVRGSHNLELTLVAPFLPLRPLFPDLLDLLVEVPVFLPQRRDLLRQPNFHQYHWSLRALGLTGFRIASDPRATLASLREWLTNLPSPEGLPLV